MIMIIKVAIAAPITPNSGIIKKPKIKIYFKIGLISVIKILIKKGIFVAPAAENEEMLTCLIKSKGMVKSVKPK